MPRCPGQRSKIILAKMLLENPDVILLDEPTNYLDTAHIEWLIEYLNDFAGAAMIISHDYDFLERVTNTIVDVSFGKITKYRGSFKQAMRQKRRKRPSRSASTKNNRRSSIRPNTSSGRTRPVPSRRWLSRVKRCWPG